MGWWVRLLITMTNLKMMCAFQSLYIYTQLSLNYECIKIKVLNKFELWLIYFKNCTGLEETNMFISSADFYCSNVIHFFNRTV